MAKIPSRPFFKGKRKISSGKFPKIQRKISSRKLAAGTPKVSDRTANADQPAKAEVQNSNQTGPLIRPTDEQTRQDAVAILKRRTQALKAQNQE